MIFSSLDFAIFLPIVFLLYWFVTNKNIKLQNFLIVFASYVFYGWWDWRFLSLMLFSTVLDYACGQALGRNEKRSTRNWILGISLFFNLGLLMFFKYFNFFLDSFEDAFSLLGYPIEMGSLNIILPVGISFYTFQTLSYTIDVYRRDLKAANDFIAFSAYVTFFPQLVAGPIERATHLLPQFYQPRVFEYDKAVDGLRQILWGLFKKVVIADNCAELANIIFNNSADYSGSTLVLGAFFFSIQIYGDFSGYSDIAIGTSRLLGFNLMQNFAFPYFSRDIAEFWRRWHISLSTWFRDYVYIPLGGSRAGLWGKVRNTFVIFLLSGFWHGANWTFIVWGALNALYFLPLLLANKNRQNLGVIAEGRLLPSFREFFGMTTTFALTVFAWIFFRAKDMEHALSYIAEIFSPSLLYSPEINSKSTILFVVLFLLIEWLGRANKYALEKIALSWKKPLRWAFYLVIALMIFLFQGTQQDFIYFQF